MATKISYLNVENQMGESWNPVVGCTKCSPGCLNCYAEKMAARLSSMGIEKYSYVIKAKHIDEKRPWNGKVFCDEKALDIPLHWRKPRRILVPSMGDLFHPKVPFNFINMVINRITHCPQHKFFLLTKHIEKAAEYYRQALKGWPQYENIHLGVTICNQAEADEKNPILLQIPAAHRWSSIEPLLGEIDFTNLNPSPKTTLNALDGWQRNYVTRAKREQRNASKYTNGIKWVVVGCESGPNRRPCKLEWIRSLVQQCKAAGVKCYVKQISLPKVVMLKNVIGEIPIPLPNRPFVEKDKIYKAIVNQHGAISAITKLGLLGLKPGEFKKIGSYVEHDMSKFPKDLQTREAI